MKRPILNEIELSGAMDTLYGGRPGAVITMSPGQWDPLLKAAYESGWTLLVIDKDEKPVKAYRRVAS